LEHFQLVRQIDQLIDVPAHCRNDDAYEVLLEFRCDLQHHAVVKQDDSGIRPDQNISGMRIGMKKTMDQKLIAVELDQILDHLLRVDIVAQDLVDLCHAEALEKFHDQDASCRDVAVNAWNDDKVVVTEQLTEPLDIVRLVMKVHFFGNHAREFVNDRSGGMDNVVIDELLQDEHQVLNDPYICRHEFFYARPKNLNDHLLAAILSSVNLS